MKNELEIFEVVIRRDPMSSGYTVLVLATGIMDALESSTKALEGTESKIIRVEKPNNYYGSFITKTAEQKIKDGVCNNNL